MSKATRKCALPHRRRRSRADLFIFRRKRTGYTATSPSLRFSLMRNMTMLVDSTTHALEWLSSHSNFQGWINYYNELAKGGDGTKPKLVRVTLPPGAFQIGVPPHYVNGGGPPVEVSEEAADELC